MARILVAGNINHDRIWHLDRTLVPGGRLSCLDREIRLGGGAYHTGAQLLRLGHTVLIAGGLMNDETGREALAALKGMGFDTTHVAVVDGKTAPADILLDPSGERTIIAPPGRRRPPVTVSGAVEADAVYVNAAECTTGLLDAMRRAPLGMAQFPARESARPADILIGSAADMSGRDYPDILAAAHRIAGARLTHLVMTDGPEPVRLIDEETIRLVPPPGRLRLADTIGAGDIFAGSYLHAVLDGLPPPDAALEACRLTERRLVERQNRQADHSPT
ncbi:PfkB family carbohydrate kinase [Rhizobiaceae bacterium BDR2-2]|uniref:PfkB family carbohydrate kinase n=1 Tax=Ectorhizobium quercum TaxID=2965071 RepID=A0AAE3ST75_9HYPH|nr:PfkB family carbohydrate kinase [Ectorhizobium quercum]MCX8995855.1 PfkB family carbohydrate kinase [Ectorhizobium quercum]